MAYDSDATQAYSGDEMEYQNTIVSDWYEVHAIIQNEPSGAYIFHIDDGFFKIEGINRNAKIVGNIVCVDMPVPPPNGFFGDADIYECKKAHINKEAYLDALLKFEKVKELLIHLDDTFNWEKIKSLMHNGGDVHITLPTNPPYQSMLNKCENVPDNLKVTFSAPSHEKIFVPDFTLNSKVTYHNIVPVYKTDEIASVLYHKSPRNIVEAVRFVVTGWSDDYIEGLIRYAVKLEGIVIDTAHKLKWIDIRRSESESITFENIHTDGSGEYEIDSVSTNIKDAALLNLIMGHPDITYNEIRFASPVEGTLEHITVDEMTTTQTPVPDSSTDYLKVRVKSHFDDFVRIKWVMEYEVDNIDDYLRIIKEIYCMRDIIRSDSRIKIETTDYMHDEYKLQEGELPGIVSLPEWLECIPNIEFPDPPHAAAVATRIIL